MGIDIEGRSVHVHGTKTYGGRAGGSIVGRDTRRDGLNGGSRDTEE